MSCRRRGISAGSLCGGDGDNDVNDFKNGRLQIVYFTPEMILLNPRYRDVLVSDKYHFRIKGLAIDEAHTIKKW